AQHARLAGALARREDELDVGAAPRLEFQFLPDGRLDALLARGAVVGAQRLHDGRTIVLVVGLERALAEHETAGRTQFLVECGGDARAPVALGHDHHATPAAAGA